ncbi:hypothetical protein MP228_011831 [Amoeboaphelidium protococcarum]|nr:hypothetical protein MP228_011831 [Amoeboaphelidium protococcarum]
MNVSTQDEVQMGQFAYNSVMSQFKNQLLPQFHPYTRLVKKVSQKLISKAQIQSSTEWEINVIDQDEQNAFVLPNGKIFVFTGLLKMIENESQLATVLAHEICHVYARHTAEKLSFLKLAMFLKLLASLFIGSDAANIVFNPVFFSLGFNLPFSRRCEEEADYLGLMLMSQACYEPSEAITFWRKMAVLTEKKGALPQFLSTHPNPERRVLQLKELMHKAREQFHKNDCDSLVDSFRQFKPAFQEFIGDSDAYRW